MHREALKLERDHFGMEAQKDCVATSLHNIGEELTNLESHEEAGKYLREALEMRRVMAGDKKDIWIAKTLKLLGQNALHQGDHGKAGKYLVEAAGAVRDCKGCAEFSQEKLDIEIKQLLTKVYTVSHVK